LIGSGKYVGKNEKLTRQKATFIQGICPNLNRFSAQVEVISTIGTDKIPVLNISDLHFVTFSDMFIGHKYFPMVGFQI
jgi:hypothetical protein